MNRASNIFCLRCGATILKPKIKVYTSVKSIPVKKDLLHYDVENIPKTSPIDIKKQCISDDDNAWMTKKAIELATK